jgi:L-ascorbate metabolism protein UlaG (beta-lactamase superfamily)
MLDEGNLGMNVTYLGHATIEIECNGSRILMDPWLTDPIYLGAWWHYPPMALRVADLQTPDYLYISHEHPDHFDPPTLQEIDKNVTVVIADFPNKRFLDRIRAIGFRKIVQLQYGEVFHWGDGLRLHLIPPDRPWDDSAILLSDGTTTVLNVNDCHLDEATLKELGNRYEIALAFLTFTGASQYPGCFDFSAEEKTKRWLASKRSHLQEFANWAKLLQTKRAVPAAGNYALLAPDQLHLNTSDYVNNPQEAVDRLAEVAPEIEGLQMNPGDRWSPGEGLQRLHPAPNWNERIAEIESLSRQRASEVAAYFAAEEPAPLDLYDRFREYFEDVLSTDPSILEQVGIVTWWQVEGPAGGDWTLDFTRERGWVSRGAPAQWNLRLQVPDRLVYLGVTDRTAWENLALSFRISLARRPDHYMEGFWTWFCKFQGRDRMVRKPASSNARSNDAASSPGETAVS